jgi:hypothetical protein
LGLGPYSTVPKGFIAEERGIVFKLELSLKSKFCEFSIDEVTNRPNFLEIE